MARKRGRSKKVHKRQDSECGSGFRYTSGKSKGQCAPKTK